MKFLFYLIAGVIIYFIISWKDKKKQEENQRKIKEQTDEHKRLLKSVKPYCSYDGHSTIIVKKQSRIIKKVLLPTANISRRIESITPDEYIFTSATVGGITTGGVDKIEGKINYAYNKTGTYSLGFAISKHCTWDVLYIKLSDELYELAKKDDRVKYLTGEWQRARRVRIEDGAPKGNVLYVATCASESYYQNIINFLCGYGYKKEKKTTTSARVSDKDIIAYFDEKKDAEGKKAYEAQKAKTIIDKNGKERKAGYLVALNWFKANYKDEYEKIIEMKKKEAEVNSNGK